MMKLLAVYVVFLPGCLLAQGALGQPAQPSAGDVMPRNNPRYSTAVVVGESPELWLSGLESDMAAAESEFDMFLLLPRVAKAALEAGLNDKATEYARKTLQLVPKFQSPAITLNHGPVSNVGDAVFTGNLVLGRLAILKGDTESAKKYLLLAGQTDGSPGLDTFGPNLSLARELLLVSEGETVLKFLDECRVFWRSERGRLDQWSLEIQSGKTPNFGNNLIY